MKLEQTSENPSTLPNPSIISVDIMPRKVVDLTASSSPAQNQLLMGLPLQNAIGFAHLDLRRTLSSICRLSVEASTLVRTLLLIPKSGTRHGRDDDEDEDEDEDDGGDKDEETEEEESDGGATARVRKVPKRLRPRYATCENCSEESGVTEIIDDTCTWHQGMT